MEVDIKGLMAHEGIEGEVVKSEWVGDNFIFTTTRDQGIALCGDPLNGTRVWETHIVRDGRVQMSSDCLNESGHQEAVDFYKKLDQSNQPETGMVEQVLSRMLGLND